MKNILTLCIILFAMHSGPIRAGDILSPLNQLGYGTVSGRLQSLSMYRDFESGGNRNGANSSMGLILNYTTPDVAGFSAGLGYNYADVTYENNLSGMLANDDINILNEGWVRYAFGIGSFSNSTVLVGRKIYNGEVFRADDFRQKSRSIEAVQLKTSDIGHVQLTVGHAAKLSNWIDSGDKWKFNNFGDVFGASYNTDGVTWGELTRTGCGDALEIALFDAYAWDVANLAGTRTKWDVSEHSALIGYYRHENDIGQAAEHHADAYGLSWQQKVGDIALEPGFFSVHGGTLRFQETTTGINHPLGASMEICSCQFNGGADSAYLKVTTTVGKTKLYGIYNYTWHNKLSFDGQELNLVIRQPIMENLSIAFKGGFGYRDQKDGTANKTDTDARLFVTYAF